MFFSGLVVLVALGVGVDPKLEKRIEAEGLVASNAMTLYREDVLVVSGDGWVQVVNISDLDKPVVAFKEYFDTTVSGIDTHEDNIFITTRKTLVIYKITQGLVVEKVTEYFMNGVCTSVKVTGNRVKTFAIVTNMQKGVQIVDVNDLKKPFVVSTLPAATSFRIATEGNYAYLAAVNNAIIMLDITAVSTSQIIGSYQTPQGQTDVAVSNQYVYSANDEGILIVDFAKPLNPLNVATYPTSCAVHRLIVTVTSKLYYTCGNGVFVLDVTKPDAPIAKGVYQSPQALSQRDLYYINGLLYVGDTNGVSLLNVLPPTPTPKTPLPTPVPIPITPVPDTNNSNSDSSSSNSSNSNMYLYLMVLLAAAVVCTCCCFGFRQRSLNRSKGGGSLLHDSFVTPMVDISTDSSTDYCPFKSPDWTIKGVVGKGAFSTVYKALTREGTVIAVKVIPVPESIQVNEPLEELRIALQLEHKHIVRHYAGTVLEGHLCISMEYLPRGSLAMLIQREMGLPKVKVVEYSRQLVSAVVYLHGMQVIHRDIKGENILLSNDGLLKLSDLGCSKVITNLTRTAPHDHTVAGTPRWMAPEVIRSSDTGYSFTADIWSIGCTVCEMLTGSPPWPVLGTIWSTMYHIANNEPEVPAFLDPDTIEFIKLLLTKDPSERPSAVEVAQHPWLGTPVDCAE